MFLLPLLLLLLPADGPYWKAVRQAAAPCFSITNLKNVSSSFHQGSPVPATSIGVRTIYSQTFPSPLVQAR
jgi:hypothetical protein